MNHFQNSDMNRITSTLVNCQKLSKIVKSYQKCSQIHEKIMSNLFTGHLTVLTLFVWGVLKAEASNLFSESDLFKWSLWYVRDAA